jgi:glycosyltransferase involved in cell wall biosynthesis
MPKKLFILAPYPFGEAPSQRFRFEQYIDQLKENELDIEFHPFLDHKTWSLLYSEGNVFSKAWGMIRSFGRRKLLMLKLLKADYIFVHREMAHLGPPIFEWFVAKVLRKKYIYDFDDAIWLPNYSETNSSFHRLKAYWKVKYCIKWAWKVTAGNDYLAEYAKRYNNNVQVIPTTIDEKGHHNLSCDHTVKPLTIGWTGTHTTMRYLDPILPVIRSLEKDHTFKFIIISNEAPEFEMDSLEYIKWNKTSEIEDLARIQIGIMPLVEDIWSEGKCGFKGLQYMSMGMAAILSPVGVNIKIIQNNKNGFLAENPDEWDSCLRELLENDQKRIDIGENARKTVHEVYSVTANEQKYINLFKDI